MTDTPNLSLPLIAAAQAQKHVTHNEALALIDAMVQLCVLSRTQTAPPSSPVEGARYLVPAGATGGFSGKATQIALFDGGGWRFLPPKAGWQAYVDDEDVVLVWNGTAWVALGQAIGGIDQLAALGIGTASDPVNRLALRAQGALMTAQRIAASGTGDIRLTLEKEAAARTGSLLFQSNYSGRAEMGLMGDNDFRVKVSADGATWRDALLVNGASGQVSFPNGVSGLSGGSGGGTLGQCRLELSGANLKLIPRNGNGLTINGATATIPPAGITLAATGLAANTTYYIYAVASAGAILALEASTTGWTVHTDGTAIKSADASRALVGMARTIAGPAWIDSAKQRFVTSWFNRRNVSFSASFTAVRSTTSISYAEINTEIRCEFLVWAGDAVSASLSGSMYNSIGTASTLASLGFNGITPSGYVAMTGSNSQPAAYQVMNNALTEGYNYVTHLGKASGGTAQFGYLAPEFNAINGMVHA
ncbi:MAG: DUF2793 domain-containing protein [Bosea sp. (in: a-proteobacteria)]